jgi:hypothetical protein
MKQLMKFITTIAFSCFTTHTLTHATATATATTPSSDHLQHQHQHQHQHQYPTVKGAAGLYVNANDPRAAPGHQNTILVTAFNYAYLNHYHNFKCFVNRLGLKHVAVGFDKSTVEYLQKLSVEDSTMFPVLFDANATRNSVEFRIGDFHKISLAKFEVVYAFLKLGYNVIFSDPDVAFVNDPMHVFLNEDMDYMHSINVYCRQSNPKDRNWKFIQGPIEGNTGLHYIKSTPDMLRFWKDFFKFVPTQFTFLDDQTLFWKYIRQRYKGTNPLKIIPRGSCPDSQNPKGSLSGPHEGDRKYSADEKRLQPTNLLSCYLDSCQFVAGAFVNSVDTVPPAPVSIDEVVDELHDQGGKTLYATHANFLTGNAMKQSRMQLNGHWLATRAADGTWNGKCLSFESLGGPRGYYNSSKYKGVLPTPVPRPKINARLRSSDLVSKQKTKLNNKKRGKVKRSPNAQKLRAGKAGVTFSSPSV